MNWIYEGSEVKDIPKCFGFIYLLTYEDGSLYIGKKNVIGYKKKPLTKKELALVTDKRLKTYKVEEYQHNWRDYNGSCKSDTVKQLKLVSKEILFFCDTKLDLTYYEEYYLMINNVLFDTRFLNNNIGGKYFSGKLTNSKGYVK